MADYKTPGVYVVEKSLFPPSVAQVETAIPAFIGYTEFAIELQNDDLANKPKRISSLKEYEQFFGFGPPITVVEVNVDLNGIVISSAITQTFYLYDSLKLFFGNGGGDCYIISIGKYSAVNPIKVNFDKGLEALQKKDEPTLILFPDLVSISGSSDFYNVQKSALLQAGDLKDRFCILDLRNMQTNDEDKTGFNNSINQFRSNIGMNELKYGAAYSPWLYASIPKNLTYENIRGKLKRNSISINLKTLTSNLTSPDQVILNGLIDQYDFLLDDKNSIGTLVNLQMTGTDKDPRSRYLTRVDDFKTKAFSLDITITADRNTIRDSFYALFDEAYLLPDLFDDLLVLTPTPFLKTSALNNLITTFASDISSSLVNLVKIDNTINNISNLIFSGGLLPRKSNNSNAQYENIFTNWVNTNLRTSMQNSTNVSPLTPQFIHSAPTSTEFQKQLENMINLEKYITEVFNVLVNTYYSILLFIKNNVGVFENNLVANFITYKNIIESVNNSFTKIPPCGAIAGSYAYVDRTRGVWKAPANVSLNLVDNLLYQVDDREQENLNVDTNSGKSINIIRYFTGRGHLIWGARTLAGNDNEWRYIPVRRFFNMVEESVKKSTSWAVFEPNDANTWVKVKGMIDNFLILQWRNGALQGAKPDDAFYVKVGLGLTMTSIDILEGRMIVEIGMAVVRPAEFIILTFMHKMVTSS